MPADEPAPDRGWTWVTGEAFGYTNWSPGEPNDISGPGSEQHLTITYQPLAVWNDEASLPNIGGYVAESLLPIASGVTLVGGPQADVLTGTALADKLFGRGRNDSLSGLPGGDLLKGGGGHDALRGGAGNDTLRGGGGRDQLFGGKCDDLMKGGEDADTFVFKAAFGADRIGDFDSNPLGGQDRMDLRGLGVSEATFDDRVTITELASDTKVTVDDFGTLILKGVAGANALDASDFLLLA